MTLWLSGKIDFRLFMLLFVLGLWLAVAPVRAEQGEGGPEDPIIVADVDIQIVEEISDGFDWLGLTRALFAFKQGQTVSRKELDQSVEQLKPLARVNLTAEPAGQGVRLHLEVRPYKRIKSIAVKGGYPLFDREVNNVMTIAPGQFFHAADMPEQESLITQRYREEGYIAPEVTISWRQDKQDGHFHVNVLIAKGPHYTLAGIRLSGQHAIAETILKGLMKTWREATVQLGKGRFVVQQLKKDIETLTAYYRSNGFADVLITYAVRIEAKAEQIFVDVTITEGPRYVIAFVGNVYFSDGALQKELILFEIGNQGNIGLRRSIENIRSRYLQAGFADVAVRREEETDPDGSAAQRRPVRIIIEEGKRHIVEKVRIRGNHHVDTETIRGQMLTREPKVIGNGVYVQAVLQEDLAAVRALYLKNGFLGARVVETVNIDTETKAVSVVFDIEEGVQTLVGSVSIEGTSPLSMKQMRSVLQLNEKQPYRPYMVQSDEDQLAAGIAAKGYPYVQARGNAVLSEDKTRADITYVIDAGQPVKVGHIFFAGNFRTREGILNRELGFEEDAPFSLAKVLAAQRNLRNLELFDSVQVRTIGLKEKEPRVHLLVETVEEKPYFFELGGGYQTDKGAYLRTKVGDHNFAGTDKDLWTGGEISEVGYRWDAVISDPRLFDSHIRGDLGLYVERQELFNQDFGSDTMGGTLTFSRNWRRYINTALGWRYEQREQYLRQNDTTTTQTDPATLERRRILVTTPSVRYDSRDSFIRPHKGLLAYVAADFSKGLEQSVDNFIKYNLDLRSYVALNRRITLAGRLGYGYLQAYDVDGQVPEDQLFFLGGTTSVRGFGENLLRYDQDGDPVGGRVAVNGSLETRIDLGQNFELTTFVDVGSIQQAEQGAGGDDDYHWAAGLGLHYLTPIGPIGLLYGQKLAPRDGESNGQFHFTIGYTF